MPGIFLILLTAAAMGCDVFCEKIPNLLIGGGLLTGAAYQWSANGPPGLLEFVLGAAIPLAVLAVPHYFRMIGAGDVKLLMAAGGFWGPIDIVKCIWLSFAIGALVSIVLLMRNEKKLLKERAAYLFRYLRDYHKNRKWTPYIIREKNKAYIHFSVPVFAANVLMAVGGIF